MNPPDQRPPPRPPPPVWKQRLWLRMRRHAVLKFVGISAFMWVFFLGYFHTLRFPVHPAFEMPLTALDHLVPFQPQALVAYVSLWLYIGAAPGLLLSVRELLLYGLWAAGLCLAGLACFYFWPTAVPAVWVADADVPGFGMLRGVDAAGNACPSLHVATAVFTAAWAHRILGIVQAPLALRLLNWAWFGVIAWSTVAIRQHVVLDAVAGAALGLAFAAVSIRTCRRVGTEQALRGQPVSWPLEQHG